MLPSASLSAHFIIALSFHFALTNTAKARRYKLWKARVGPLLPYRVDERLPVLIMPHTRRLASCPLRQPLLLHLLNLVVLYEQSSAPPRLYTTYTAFVERVT